MNIDLALELLITLMTQGESLITQGKQLASAINKARAEGRTDLSDAEVDTFAALDDAAKKRVDEWLSQKGANAVQNSDNGKNDQTQAVVEPAKPVGD